MKLGIFIQEKYKESLLELIRALFTESEYGFVNRKENLTEFDEYIDIDVSELKLAVKFKSYDEFDESIIDISDSFSKVITNQNGSSKLYIKKTCYDYIKKRYKRISPWGILTGVRPVKLVHKMMDEGWSDDIITTELCTKFMLSNKNSNLILDIAKRENEIIEKAEGKSSLYFSIPFCPSKCVYCSFPTHVYSKWKHLEDDYIDSLCREVEMISGHIKEPIYTVYIGGGTPSSIKKESIKKMMTAINSNFDLTEIVEFTYEAGRPETIDDELLGILKEYGVTRISINPQTFNDDVLKKMGRTHDSKAILDAYDLARKYEMDINMDLILGLPDDTKESYKKTLKKIIELSPSNVTIHSLSIKRAAELKKIVERYDYMADEDILGLVDQSLEALSKNGYKPYYLYRQQHISGNLANVGYAKPGKEGIYNILMMEEVHPIYSFGVGGVSKIFDFSKNKFQALPNFRDIVPYLDRFDEMVKKKIDSLTNS